MYLYVYIYIYIYIYYKSHPNRTMLPCVYRPLMLPSWKPPHLEQRFTPAGSLFLFQPCPMPALLLLTFPPRMSVNAFGRSCCCRSLHSRYLYLASSTFSSSSTSCTPHLHKYSSPAFPHHAYIRLTFRPALLPPPPPPSPRTPFRPLPSERSWLSYLPSQAICFTLT